MQSYLAGGGSLAALRNGLAGSDAAAQAISDAFNGTIGRPLTANDAVCTASVQSYFMSGGAWADYRTSLAESDDARAALESIYQMTLGAAPDDLTLADLQGGLIDGQSLTDVQAALGADAAQDASGPSVTGPLTVVTGFMDLTGAFAKSSLVQFLADASEVAGDFLSGVRLVVGLAASGEVAVATALNTALVTPANNPALDGVVLGNSAVGYRLHENTVDIFLQTPDSNAPQTLTQGGLLQSASGQVLGIRLFVDPGYNVTTIDGQSVGAIDGHSLILNDSYLTAALGALQTAAPGTATLVQSGVAVLDYDNNKCPLPVPTGETLASIGLRNAVYQEWVTGLPVQLGPFLNGKKFDGCRPSDGVMLEALGFYNHFIVQVGKDGPYQWQPWFAQSARGVSDIVNRISTAATAASESGKKVEFHVATPGMVGMLQIAGSARDWSNVTFVDDSNKQVVNNIGEIK